MRRWGLGVVFAWISLCVSAQDLVVYDDAARNDFNEGFSYNGGADFAHAVTVNSGTLSIAFTGNVDGSNAVAFGRPGFADLTTATYPTLRFFVNGGTVGGQQLRLTVQRNSETSSTVVASGELDPYVIGGAIVPGAWREVRVPLAAFGVTGGFDRIDLQSDLGGGQPVLYIDDVAFLAAIRPDALFLDGFEGDAAAPAGTLQFTPTAPDQNVGENAGTATFTVSRVGGTAGVVGTTVTLGGTAANPADYTSSTLALSWGNGDAANKTVTLTIVNDDTDEPNETVSLALGAPTGGASLGVPTSATLTITDDDPAPAAGSLQFTPAAPDQNVGENAGTATFTVSRVGGTAGVVGTTVTLGGTAANPADYANSALALSWGNGDAASKTVTLTIADDNIDEPNETVTLTLGAPSGGASLGAPSGATLTITDNDPAASAGTLQFTPAAPNQSATETSGAITLTVSRVGGTSGAVGTTVSPSGTATNPADYTNGSLALSWADGDGSNKTISITPVADLIDEASESVTLQLGAPTGGATLGAPSSATLTITDAELMFVPQWDTRSIKVYRRAPAGFALVASASFGAGVRPNSVTFAPDGMLWVVDENGALLRFSRSAILAGGSPAPEVTIGGMGGCCLFQLAFFGDFAYVSQSNFTPAGDPGAVNRILRYPVASLAASGSPAFTALTHASLDVPAGLAFDPQGRLWISNNAFNRPANTSIVRMSTVNGAVDRTGTPVAVSGRTSLVRPEGLAFDSLGTLWVGNNGEQTIAAYSDAQINSAGFGATVPVHLIDVSPGAPLTDSTFGGLAFDAPGALWANYQRSPFEVREYLLTPGANGSSYQSQLRQVLTDATTFPGFGGLAFWPVPATVHRSGGSGPVVAMLQAQTNTMVAGMMSDRFTWIDASGNPRSAALAHNDKGQGPTSPDGYPNHGGSMREYAFAMPGGATRTATVTNYGNAGQGGFGYVVSHARSGNCGGDGSPLGYGTPGNFQRIATGRHHAIFRFTQGYPRQCNSAGAAAPTTMPVTIDWLFATGRDNPLWAITYDLSGFLVGRFDDDSRAPYGEFNIDGDGFAHAISGVAWGDRFKFTSNAGAGGVHLGSPWSYVGANSVPWVKLWITASDATMGIVQTQTLDQQDAGAGRNRFVYDLREWWNETSAGGNNAGPGYAMPNADYWAYQANSFSILNGVASNNARLTWGTQYGFLGQASYETNNMLPALTNTGNATGYPRKSYSTYVVLGAHSTGPVETQVAEVEAVQQTTFSATVGTVALQALAGPGRLDNATLQPAGWDHVYGVWTVDAAGNAATVNFAVGAGTLRNPILGVRNWVGTTLPASVTLNGTALVQDVDYFPSIIDAADELLITLSRTLAGANNRVVIAQ